MTCAGPACPGWLGWALCPMLLIRFSTTSLEPSQGLRLFINGTNSSRSVRKRILRVSLSWLAKARMRGDGPPFIKLGEKSIRYSEAALLQWMKGRQRLSTSPRWPMPSTSSPHQKSCENKRDGTGRVLSGQIAKALDKPLRVIPARYSAVRTDLAALHQLA